jgi:Zn-dependent M28 family amino/carboxypeptidase
VPRRRGPLGSEHYVAALSQAEQDKIALYLNFDMVGSPNHFFGIYDGDYSSGTAGVAYDSCYHQPCNTRSNLNLTASMVQRRARARQVARARATGVNLVADPTDRTGSSPARALEW